MAKTSKCCEICKHCKVVKYKNRYYDKFKKHLFCLFGPPGNKSSLSHRPIQWNSITEGTKSLRRHENYSCVTDSPPCSQYCKDTNNKKFNDLIKEVEEKRKDKELAAETKKKANEQRKKEQEKLKKERLKEKIKRDAIREIKRIKLEAKREKIRIEKAKTAKEKEREKKKKLYQKKYREKKKLEQLLLEKEKELIKNRFEIMDI